MKKLHVSTGNIKMGKIFSVSLSPIISCPKGIPCSKDCYAVKAYASRPSVKLAWDDNLEFAKNDEHGFFTAIDKYLKTRKKPIKFFRWHVAGDILSQSYLNQMNMIATNNPNTRFLAFTKHHGLDFNGLQENLVIVFSMWAGWGDISVVPVGMPKAWMQDGNETRVPDDALECIGSCSTCGMCWHLPRLKKDVVFYKH